MSDKTLTLNKTPEVAEKAAEKAPAKAYVRVASGRMVHMLTNKEITTTPTKMEVDFWLKAQIDAGKVLVGELD